jgi:hypothetical protein
MNRGGNDNKLTAQVVLGKYREGVTRIDNKIGGRVTGSSESHHPRQLPLSSRTSYAQPRRSSKVSLSASSWSQKLEQHEVGHNPVNEMVRRLISTLMVDDCFGRFKEDHRYADTFGWH